MTGASPTLKNALASSGSANETSALISTPHDGTEVVPLDARGFVNSGPFIAGRSNSTAY
jgi:hypothetical protein